MIVKIISHMKCNISMFDMYEIFYGHWFFVWHFRWMVNTIQINTIHTPRLFLKITNKNNNFNNSNGAHQKKENRVFMRRGFTNSNLTVHSWHFVHIQSIGIIVVNWRNIHIHIVSVYLLSIWFLEEGYGGSSRCARTAPRAPKLNSRIQTDLISYNFYCNYVNFIV